MNKELIDGVFLFIFLFFFLIYNVKIYFHFKYYKINLNLPEHLTLLNFFKLKYFFYNLIIILPFFFRNKNEFSSKEVLKIKKAINISIVIFWLCIFVFFLINLFLFKQSIFPAGASLQLVPSRTSCLFTTIKITVFAIKICSLNAV